jgi:hypothetical protein
MFARRKNEGGVFGFGSKDNAKYENQGTANIAHRLCHGLTMRLSDAKLRRRQTKLRYPDHRPSPWLTNAAAPRSLEPIVNSNPAQSNLEKSYGGQ